MSGLFCIWRSGKAEEQKSRRAGTSKRDARYEERERQIRVTEMRDTKSGKSKKSKSELEDKRFDKQ
ncbi:hypothetical protein BCT55_21820 [Vibrio splendidus]|nr:hypothetical protein BCT55_21820 [Vibrio splendidus]